MRVRLASLLVLLLAAAASADLVYLAGGRRIKGAVVRDDESQVVVNTYNSRHPEAALGTETFPRAQVRKIVREEDPLHEYRRRSAGASTAEAHLELAAFCEEHRLNAERQRELLRAFALDPASEAVRKEISATKAERLVRAEPTLNPRLREALAAYLAEEDAGRRKTARAEIRKTFGYDPGDLYLERAWRSARAPRGLREDMPLTLRARDIKAVYTLLVPKGYDPVTPTPLVVGLHGGGPGGKERDKVVGSGRQAMVKFGRAASSRGWIAVCPTAIRAGWGAKVNRELILTLIEEISLRYNVDRNRIYLVGHSMGGFGTFAVGPAHPELFAAIAPMSGGGAGGSMRKLKDTRTGIYIYHSADDNVCRVAGSRVPADSLRDLEADFVYTEVNGAGHGIASGVVKDIFDFFAVRTLARGKGRRFTSTHEPDPSFLAKVTRDEKTYLGDPLAATPARASDDAKRKELLSGLRKGGGAAKEAADALISLADPKTRKPLGDLAASPRWDPDVRAEACRVLGRIGDEGSVRALGAALRAEEAKVRDAAARALGALGLPKGLAPLLRSLDTEWADLDRRRIAGNHFHYSDWEVLLRSFAIRARALAELGDPAAVGPLRRVVIDKVLGGDWQVYASARAGQDANRPRRACALAVCESLETLGGADAAAAIRELRKRRNDDAKVVRRCDQALEKLE
jgi:pimeloyl-ACP methyl ester carboxylesterase